MGEILYAIGNSGLLVDSQGWFAGGSAIDDQILRADENPKLVRDLLIGDAIINSGPYSTLSDEDKSGFLPEFLKDAFELIEILGTVYELAEKLNKWVSKHPVQADPLVASLNLIHEKLNVIGDTQLAAWATNRGDNLAFLQAHSTSALMTLGAFLQSGKTRSDPEWSGRLDSAERDSLIAAQACAKNLDDGFWLRPYSLKALTRPGLYGNPAGFTYGWMPYMPDRAEQDDFGRVWDYRWALPAFIYAISCRIAVIMALGGMSPAERDEIEKYNNLLASVFQRMEDGVRISPSLSEQQRSDILAHSLGVPVAVADIYGGRFYARCFWHFYEREFEGAPIPQDGLFASGHLPNSDEGALNLNQIGRWWWNIVCREIGLPELLMFCGAIENLINSPPNLKEYVTFYPEVEKAGKSSAADLARGLLKYVEFRDTDSRSIALARLYAGATTMIAQAPEHLRSFANAVSQARGSTERELIRMDLTEA